MKPSWNWQTWYVDFWNISSNVWLNIFPKRTAFILVISSCRKNSSSCKHKALFFLIIKHLAAWLLTLIPIYFLNFVPNPRVLSYDNLTTVSFFFVDGVNVSQIIFKRDISEDTGVRIYTGESIIDILGVSIDNELSGVEDRSCFCLLLNVFALLFL